MNNPLRGDDLKFLSSVNDCNSSLSIDGSKIMIVDDNSFNTMLLEETISPLSVEVETFENPINALDKINKKKYDLFMLDIMMPEMSGFDLANHIRKSSFNSDTPIVFISALSDVEHKIKSYACGSCAYIEKPFDINVVRAQIESLLKANIMRRELSQKREKYWAMVTHDMKGPIFAEVAALELVLNQYGQNLCEEQKEILKDILNSTKYLKDLVSNVLHKYKDDNGTIVLSKKFCSFKELLFECKEELRYLASEKQQKILIKYNSETEFLNFDYQEIKRVVNNLLTNSIKYGNKNSVIQIEILENTKNLIFIIKNEGVGLVLKNPNDVFEKFISYSEEHKSINTGLGLYIAKQLITAHGGKIYFNSIPNQYTQVTFTLPK